MALVTYTIDNSTSAPVGIITMDDEKMNAYSFSMAAALEAALDTAEGDESVALVLAGNKRSLSAGFDLSVMGPKGDIGERSVLLLLGAKLVNRLFRFRKPLVVAATGHGLALGAIFLLAADLRIGPKPGGKAKFGLNEVAIGMTLPAFGTELARLMMPPREFRQCVGQAKVGGSELAVEQGFLDALVTESGPEAVIAAALSEASRLGVYLKQPAFAQQKLVNRAAALEILELEVQKLEAAAKKNKAPRASL